MEKDKKRGRGRARERGDGEREMLEYESIGKTKREQHYHPYLLESINQDN